MSTGNSHAHADHAHHFESAEHEYLSGKEGVWLFLTTEILMFGGLFVAYILFKNLYPQVFHDGGKLLDWRLGGLNTIVLLTSSLTMALSIHYVQKGKNSQAIACLWITLICAAAFMVVKYFEYSHKIHMGTLPNKFFHLHEELPSELGEVPKNLALFFGLYFVMTGLHGIHVLVGMGLIYWMIVRTKRGDFHPKKYTALEGVGLYWHLVDLIWIYLFPLLYLVS